MIIKFKLTFVVNQITGFVFRANTHTHTYKMLWQTLILHFESVSFFFLLLLLYFVVLCHHHSRLIILCFYLVWNREQLEFYLTLTLNGQLLLGHTDKFAQVFFFVSCIASNIDISQCVLYTKKYRAMSLCADRLPKQSNR